MAQKLDYYNITHTGLSYSRQLTLHRCPKQYELDAKKAIKGRIESVTFSYGHAVGAGVQATINGASFNRAILETILAYTHDEDDDGSSSEKAAKKSVWTAVIAIEEFHKRYNAGLYTFLDGWEIAKFEDRDGNIIPAVELTFVIQITDDYSYEGHIDLVLYNPTTNRYMVVELKTTGATSISDASYKNSAQALGYGVVVDLIARNLNASASFDVLYLVYKSRFRELVPFVFKKTPAMRADWINNILTDCNIIELYESNGYPRHGEGCYAFFRACQYLDVCHMTDEALNRMYGSVYDNEELASFAKMSSPTFMFHIDELLARQEQLINMTATEEAELSDVDMLLDVVQIKG